MATTSSTTSLRRLDEQLSDGSATPAVELESLSLDLSEPNESSLNIALQEDVPPNGGYAWVCTACVFLINAHTWGINSAWGVFLAHYFSSSTFPGTSQLQFALIGGLSISQCLVISPAVSMAHKKLGLRPTLFIGSILIFLSLLGASFATEVWHLFLSQGVCFGWGMGFLYITASAVLPQWFSTKRSLALGIATSGAGLGGLAYNLGAGAAIETLGLNWTYRLLALCALVSNLVCSIFLKDRNKSIAPHQRAFNYREYGKVEVLLIILWGWFTELGYITLLYSLPSYATTIGLTAAQGSVVGALLNLGLGIGRPVVGYYSDVVGRINVATLMTATCGVLCLAVWIPANSYPVLLTFAILAGLACGTFWATVTPVAAEVVGMQRLPSVWGMICLSLVIPTTFAEPIALQLAAASGYITTQVFVGGMFLLGAAMTWILRSWKVFEVEQKAANERALGSTSSYQLPKSRDMWLTPRRLFRIAKV